MVSGQRGVRLPPPPESAPPDTAMTTDTGVDKENSEPQVATASKYHTRSTSKTRKPFQSLIQESNGSNGLHNDGSGDTHTTEDTYRGTLLQRAEESGEFCPQAWVNLIHHDWEDARRTNDEKTWSVVYDTVQSALNSVQQPYKTDASWVKCLLYDARLTRYV